MPVDPATFAEIIPLTAWDQAAIIVLFCLFVYALLFLVLSRTDKLEKARQDWQEKQNEKWQKAYRENSEDSRRFFAALSQATEQDAQKRLALTESILTLCNQMSQIVSDIHVQLERHDRETVNRINEAMKLNADNVKNVIESTQKTKPRPKPKEPTL